MGDMIADQRPSGWHQLPPLIPRARRTLNDKSQASEPPPQTPILSAPPSSLSGFQVPSKRILSPDDLALFQNSATYTLVLSFIFGLSDSVRQKTVAQVAATEQAEIIKSLLSILDEAERLLEQNPRIETGSRFGNPAFRDYIGAVTRQSTTWHQQLTVSPAAMPEVTTYLNNSFGSASRIDYGSGHELNFFLWLLCLNRLSLLHPTDFPSVALIVFPRYLSLMRAVQQTYYLEPAGSHGVWGLDDYQFLPFLFGASQLVKHAYITPRSIHSQATIEECRQDYLYLDHVAFVNSIKNVDGLRWHSPMLDDISAARNWEKIEAGMKKMFIKEVLSKLPVMQHFLFGTLIPATQGMSEEVEPALDSSGNHSHEHGKQSWDDCCGIKVPSSLGAAGEEKRHGREKLRRLPFD